MTVQSFVTSSNNVGPAASYREPRLIDWLNRPPLTQRADSAGKATIALPKVGAALRWGIERIVVANDGTATPTVRVYIGDEEITNIVDGTTQGDLDIAEYDNPMLVSSQRQLTVVWTGADADSLCILRLQYGVYRFDTLEPQGIEGA